MPQARKTPVLGHLLHIGEMLPLVDLGEDVEARDCRDSHHDDCDHLERDEHDQRSGAARPPAQAAQDPRKAHRPGIPIRSRPTFAGIGGPARSLI